MRTANPSPARSGDAHHRHEAESRATGGVRPRLRLPSPGAICAIPPKRATGRTERRNWRPLPKSATARSSIVRSRSHLRSSLGPGSTQRRRTWRRLEQRPPAAPPSCVSGCPGAPVQQMRPPYVQSCSWLRHPHRTCPGASGDSGCGGCKSVSKTLEEPACPSSSSRNRALLPF